MNKICGVYKITNPEGKIYIGSSTDIHERKRSHKNLINKTPYLNKLVNSYITFGFENHNFIFIDECDSIYLKQREKYWIDYYDSLDKGLNSNYVSCLNVLPYEYKGIPNDPFKKNIKHIILNMETGIYYLGYTDLFISYPNETNIYRRFKGYRPKSNIFVLT